MTHLQNRLVLPVCFLLLGATSLAHAQKYDAAKYFSATTNTDSNNVNPFKYGSETTLGGAFNMYMTYSANSFAPFSSPIESFDHSGTTLDVPAVLYNNSSSDYQVTTGGTTITIDADQLALHPGQNGEYSIVRFNVQKTGLYDISGLFSGADSKPTTTDVHVLHNNISLFDGDINGSGQIVGNSNTANYALNTVLLTSGDTLDFAVGYGGNKTFYYDTTAFNAKIAAVPELSTFLGFGSLLALGSVSTFRKRKQSRLAA